MLDFEWEEAEPVVVWEKKKEHQQQLVQQVSACWASNGVWFCIRCLLKLKVFSHMTAAF